MDLQDYGDYKITSTTFDVYSYHANAIQITHTSLSLGAHV